MTSAPPVETFEYEIKKGDSCAKIAKRIYGNRKHHEVIHQYNPWLGAQMPHHLEPGQKLVLPKSLPPERPDATITAAQRRVEARSPDTPDWSTAAAGLDLWRGWRVNTHERASAEITFRDDSRIEMRESTLVIIYGGSRSKARRQTAEAVLDRGSLRSRLGAYTGKGDRGVTVTTPSAIAQFDGGETLVTVDGEGTSRVANHGQGKAAVKGKSGGEVKIKPKMGSKVNKGKRPEKPKPLPPTPAWIERGPVMFAAAGDRGGMIHGEWGAIAKAKAYRVEISRDPDGRDVMTNHEVTAETLRFEAKRLPPGDYYVSVATIDNDAFESPRSVRRKLTVVSVGLLTPGAAPLLEAPALDDTEAADADLPPLPVLRGTRLDVPGDLRCSIDQAEPTREPVLDQPGEHTVACITADDRPVPGFRIAVVDMRVAAAQAERATVVRGQSSTAKFSLDAEVPLPKRIWVQAPEGIVVGAPVPAEPDGQWIARVHAEPGAPAQATLRLMADVGGEQVELGQIDLSVDDAPAQEPTAPPVERPERHMIEGGVFGGLMFPSPNHDLYQKRLVDRDNLLPRQQLEHVAGSIGIRAGYYPIRWVGIELENGLGPTKIRDIDSRATIYAIRGQVLGQMPWRVTPTLHVGGGVLGIGSLSVLGREFDPAFHFGAGVKFYATRWLALRVDVRDTISEGHREDSVSHTPEVIVGASVVLGRRSAAAPGGGRGKAAH
ncbi:MAG: LysM peptidoglycan-binding domain-containing protein [Myxococcota bacterium]